MQEASLKLVRHSMHPRFEALCAFVTAQIGWEAAECAFLAGDASLRKYYRATLPNGSTAVVMDAPPEHEPLAPFLAVDAFLIAQGFSAPKVLAQDAAQGFLLLEDLGDDSFTRLLKAQPLQETALYFAACDTLAELHRVETPLFSIGAATERGEARSGGPNGEWGAVAPTKEYNEEKLMAEVALFADWYLVAALGESKAAALRAEYLALWQEILAQLPFLPPVAVLRDYHADNLLWLPQREGVQRVGLLDFQDALMGSPAYDVVSLLEDARRDVAPEIAQMSLNRYLQAMSWDKPDFMVHYAVLGAQRNSKILGIFTRLARRDHKPHYLAYLPRVWNHLHNDLRHAVLKPLREWTDKHLPEAARLAG